MKTRLSEKTKSRLQKEQISLGVLKHKTCHSNSEIKKEKILHHKKEASKTIKKTSPLCSEMKSNTNNNGNASFDTGKKLMMLRCINREEAMEGKDFIFTVHYIDSADNFAFDSVLMQKQIVDNEKCVRKGKEIGLNDTNIIDTQKMETSSETTDGTIQNDCLHTRKLCKGVSGEVSTKYNKETKTASGQVAPSFNLEKTTDCKNDDKNQEANKLFNSNVSTIHSEQNIAKEIIKSAPIAKLEKKNRDAILEEHCCSPIQNIEITTDHIATRKSLKRNLKEEFADAFRQNKGEKKILIEVGCSDKLSTIAKSMQSQKELPLAKNTALNNKSDFDVSGDEKSSHLSSTKALINGIGITAEIPNSTKIPHSAETSNDINLAMQISKSDAETSNFKQMQNINDICMNNHTAHDKNDNLSSTTCTVPICHLKESCNVDELFCDASFNPDGDQVVQKIHLLANTLENANNISDAVDSDKSLYINNKEKSKVTINETELIPSADECFQKENRQNSEVLTDCSLQKILPSGKTENTPTLFSKKCSMECKGKQSDVKSDSLGNRRAKSRVKVNGKTSAQTPNARNCSSRHSLQKHVLTKNVVTAKECAPVISKRRSSTENVEESVLQPRITRSLLKKLNEL